MADIVYEAILCIVNTGFSDAAMAAARRGGASGGTVIHSRSMIDSEAERLFNISLQNEREMLLIIAGKEDRDQIMHELYRDVGIGTPAQGMILSLPIDGIVGLPNHPAKNDGSQEEAPETPV